MRIRGNALGHPRGGERTTTFPLPEGMTSSTVLTVVELLLMTTFQPRMVGGGPSVRGGVPNEAVVLNLSLDRREVSHRSV